jgi:two-component system, chemotaxis family, sensor kinase Cph1
VTSGASHTPAYVEVDLSTCDREPIHIPGAIQPHGVLLALDEDQRVVMASVNVGLLLGTAHEHAIGADLYALLGAGAAQAVAERIADWTPAEPLVLTLPGEIGGVLAGEEVDITIHRSGERVVVEIESLGRPRSTLLSYQSARSAMARLAAWQRVDGLLAQLAVEIRTLTEFDRVMVYRFDRNWNGEVVAEERREDLNPYLGLHYPASDIPAQARRMYTVNWTRLIADVRYQPVHLDPVVDPGTGEPLDLTHSTLRSVSPIHLEYLSNMGVTASMSVSIVIDGELWGLVACHHYSGPHRPSRDARSAAEFLGQVTSSQIAELERAEAREDALAVQSTLSRISARVTASEEPPLQQLADDPEVLDLVRASGLAICYGDEITTRGDVPDESALRRIADKLLVPPYGEPVASDSLPELDRALGLVADVAAGALGIGSSDDSWIIWLRPELPEIVDWGGDPHNSKLYATEGDEVRLSPRKSFDLWREVVRGHSQPWAEWELDVVRSLRTFMNAVLLQRSREQIAVAESLQRTVLASDAPTLDGIDVAVRYESASSYRLGGDWWDALQLDGGRVAFVVGDVAGHGVSAVGAMTQVRAALRAHMHGGATACQSLDLLDSLVVDLLPEQVATAVVAVVDPAAGTVELCSAGHPPPLLVRADGAVSELPVQSRPLLGVGAGESTATSVDLQPGDTVLLYTDGLVERRDDDVTSALERLRREGFQARPGSVDELVDQLLAGLPGTGDDDTTVLAVRLAPPS